MADIKSALRSQLEDCRNMYGSDIEALSDDALSKGFAGTTRAAFDYSYEVAVINRRFATVLRGGSPGKWPFEGWAVAPETHRTKEAAKAEVVASMDDLIAAVDAMSETDFTKDVTRPDGSTTSPIAMITFCLIHTSYHDGQLNYLQSLHGDEEIHWG